LLPFPNYNRIAALPHYGITAYFDIGIDSALKQIRFLYVPGSKSSLIAKSDSRGRLYEADDSILSATVSKLTKFAL